MDKSSLLQKLTAYAKEGYLPMHMPGHKRCGDFPYSAPLPFDIDITEIDAFDDLNHPSEIFLESERLAASLWGSDECIYSVNGSSGAILSAIRGVLLRTASKKVLMSRGCHKSVYHGVEICRAVPVFLSAEANFYGFHTEVSPDEVRLRLAQNPDTALVIITSPTYEGVISDVREIARVCHEAGVPLMVDEAHGAHLSLHGIFPEGAVACGADIVVQSIHKTLPSLTQTALMHLSGDLIDKSEIRRQMAVFQTTSPSYILSGSLDGAVRYLASDDGKKRMRNWHSAVTDARHRLASLENFSLYQCESYDPSKLVICGGGTELSDFLRHNHKIELEMSSLSYVIAMTGIGDSDDTLDRFVKALLDADKNSNIKPYDAELKLRIPQQAMIPSDAVERETVDVPITEAVGRVSASYVYAYPPGTPIIIPGEICDVSLLCKAQTMLQGRVILRGLNNGRIKVIKE